MKRIIFSLVALSLFYIFWPSSEQPSEPEFEEEYIEEEYDEPAISQETNKETPEPTIIQPQPTMVQVSKIVAKDEVIKVRKLPRGVVEFKVTMDSWAVAHGDILLGKLQKPIQGERGQFKPKKSVLWDTNEIPFAISSDFSKDRLVEITEVMSEFSDTTNVNFYMVGGADTPKDYIIFIPSEDKCASYLGKIGGQQPIFLKPDCGKKEIRHEVMHALGFVHEQSRRDRDSYVKINWGNIEPGYENQFDIAPDAYLESYRGFVFAFDYNSVMLYSELHFSKDKKSKTIESTTNKEISPSFDRLSPVDVQRINYLYSGN